MANNQGYEREDAYKTLEMINTWINNIDTKVSFALALEGILIGFIFTKGLPCALDRVITVGSLAELSGGEVIGALLVLGLYIISFIAIICFMLAIRARIKNPNNSQSIFFFGSIAKELLVDYQVKVDGMTEENIMRDLEEQIHTNSMICNKKARCYNWGIIFLIWTVVLWFVCMTFQLI